MERPSVEECVQGFERILDKINPEQLTMLRAHYHSGGRTATMRELATAAGYADYKMASLQYGNLAKQLIKLLVILSRNPSEAGRNTGSLDWGNSLAGVASDLRCSA